MRIEVSTIETKIRNRDMMTDDEALITEESVFEFCHWSPSFVITTVSHSEKRFKLRNRHSIRFQIPNGRNYSDLSNSVGRTTKETLCVGAMSLMSKVVRETMNVIVKNVWKP